MDKGAHKTARRIMLIAIAIICVALLIMALAVIAMRAYNSQQSRIESNAGIQEDAYTQINGIDQHLQIRGADRDNPVILWLHGGPANPLAYLTYYYQAPLEKDYTIAYWEQRGCGRVFYRNEDNGDLTIGQMLDDTNAIVDYLRERFDKEKVVIIGHSWGTILGMEYINAHSEKVAAYIGVGQITDFLRGKIHAAEVASQAALDSGNKQDFEMLKKCIDEFSKTESIDQVNAESLEEMVLTTLKYLRSFLMLILSAIECSMYLTYAAVNCLADLKRGVSSNGEASGFAEPQLCPCQ